MPYSDDGYKDGDDDGEDDDRYDKLAEAFTVWLEEGDEGLSQLLDENRREYEARRIRRIRRQSRNN